MSRLPGYRLYVTVLSLVLGLGFLMGVHPPRAYAAASMDVVLEVEGAAYPDPANPYRGVAGNTVQVRYLLTNTGDEPLTGISFSEPSDYCYLPDSLQPGDTAYCFGAPYRLPDQLGPGSLAISATAQAPDGSTLPGSGVAYYDLGDLDVSKSGMINDYGNDVGGLQPGDVVGYTVRVRKSSAVTSVVVTDPMVPDLSCQETPEGRSSAMAGT